MKNLATLFGMIIISLAVGCKSTNQMTTSTREITEHRFDHRTEIVTLPSSNTIVLPTKIPPTRKVMGRSTIIIEPTIGGLSTLTVNTPENISRIDTVYIERTDTAQTHETKVVTTNKTPRWIIWTLVVLVALVIWAYKEVLLKLIPGISWLRFLKL